MLGYTGARLALWSQASDSYTILSSANHSDMLPGVGYWARFPQPVTFSTVLGTPVSTASNFDIPLSAGWTAVGDPFPASIPLSSLLVSNGSESLAAAQNAGLIGSTVWKYDPAAHTYAAAASLDPGVGYWVYATSATELQVPPPGS